MCSELEMEINSHNLKQLLLLLHENLSSEEVHAISLIMSHLKLSEKELEQKLVEFEDAISSSKEIDSKFDKIFLTRLLIFYNGNVTKAMHRLMTNIDLRESYSKILFNRDTFNPKLRKLIDLIEMVVHPKVTKDNNRIVTIRLIDFEADNLVFEDAVTVCTMAYDVASIIPEADQLAHGEILIFDFKGLTAKHLTKLRPSPLKCFIKYMIEAHPLRINQVHVVNSNFLLDKLLFFVSPFTGAKALKSLNFHLPGSKTLFDFVPRDFLYEEYGGTLGPIEAQKNLLINRSEQKRNYLLDDDCWKRKKQSEADEPLDEAFNYLAFC